MKYQDRIEEGFGRENEDVYNIGDEMINFSNIGEEEEIKNEELRECLLELRFPVTKKDLLAFAKRHCPQDAIERIKSSSVERFNSLGEVEEFIL